jgi:hypothetical protein
MPFQYETVVPWGRSFEEYQRMFALTEEELGLRILGCADGPAGFNAHMAERGRHMVSCDPLYQLTSNQIRNRIDTTYNEVIGKARQNLDKLVWTAIRSPDELGLVRAKAMGMFLADFEQGKREGRYVAAELPHLPFRPSTFDIAVCSHFLFLYSDNLTMEFHWQAVEAMCMVAREARIFPLLTYNAEPSPYFEPLVEKLTHSGYEASIECVPYEFLRGANQMLKVRRVSERLFG